MILDKFLDTIHDFNLFQKGDKICVAYSGGRDSTALLFLLLEIRRDWDLSLYLGHFNHGIRASSDDDERFVRKIASSQKIPLFVESVDVPSYAKRNRLNLEESGRLLRYEFLDRIAETIGEAKIATGHTMSDQAETFFLRLIRGSGSRGLAGIYPVIDSRVIRPLLRIEREEIEDYLKKKRLEYCIDESNFDPSFMRNRIRIDLIPYLQKNFDPKIVPRLGKLTSLLMEEDSLLDSLSADKTRDVLLERDDRVALDIKKLLGLPLAIQRRVVRHFIHALKGDLRRISFEDVEKILKLDEGKEFSLKGSLVLKREQGLIFVKEGMPSKVQYAYSWMENQILNIGELGMRFVGTRQENLKFSSMRTDNYIEAYLDLDKLQFPLHVRNRQDGDRYQPLGSPGRKKLKEIMRAKNIPRPERGRNPVFLSGDEIVWVLGLPVSEKHKITPKTRTAFVVSVIPEGIPNQSSGF
ncbi:MAG: tRNA lysidine(34) synthetase TilS [Candidatus Aminicenantes bacterium]|nr:tRNA lysidine(34) synthetase TilS [Candidatus Aminicenantes bacterium]